MSFPSTIIPDGSCQLKAALPGMGSTWDCLSSVVGGGGGGAVQRQIQDFGKGVVWVTVKPKLLAPGNFALPKAKDSTFALPKAKITNMLVSLVLGDAKVLRWPCTFHFLCVDFICVG